MKIRPTNRRKGSLLGGISAGVKHLRLDDDYTLTAKDFAHTNYLVISSINNVAGGPSYQQEFTVQVPVYTVWLGKILLHCFNGSAGTDYLIDHEPSGESNTRFGGINDFIWQTAGPHGETDDKPLTIDINVTSGGGGRG